MKLKKFWSIRSVPPPLDPQLITLPLVCVSTPNPCTLGLGESLPFGQGLVLSHKINWEARKNSN